MTNKKAYVTHYKLKRFICNNLTTSSQASFRASRKTYKMYKAF